MKNSTIGIIGAMDSEIKSLKSLLLNTQEIKQGEFTFYKGCPSKFRDKPEGCERNLRVATLKGECSGGSDEEATEHDTGLDNVSGKTVIIVKSGVGKVASAVCAQIMIDKFNPDFIINTGVAGGLKKGLHIGDIVIAEKLVQHDFDVSALGYAKGYICNGINTSEPTYFYADKNLVEKLKSSITGNYHIGVIASGDIFVASNDKKKELNENFGAVAAEMEGAAIAHCAVLNKIPFAVIRSISDLADNDAKEGYKFNEEQSAEISAKSIEKLLQII